MPAFVGQIMSIFVYCTLYPLDSQASCYSPWGCCPDGVSPVLGANNEGCPAITSPSPSSSPSQSTASGMPTTSSTSTATTPEASTTRATPRIYITGAVSFAQPALDQIREDNVALALTYITQVMGLPCSPLIPPLALPLQSHAMSPSP